MTGSGLSTPPQLTFEIDGASPPPDEDIVSVMESVTLSQSISVLNSIEMSTSSLPPWLVMRWSWPGVNLVIAGSGATHWSSGTSALKPYGSKVIDPRQPKYGSSPL